MLPEYRDSIILLGVYQVPQLVNTRQNCPTYDLPTEQVIPFARFVAGFMKEPLYAVHGAIRHFAFKCKDATIPESHSEVSVRSPKVNPSSKLTSLDVVLALNHPNTA